MSLLPQDLRLESLGNLIILGSIPNSAGTMVLWLYLSSKTCFRG